MASLKKALLRFARSVVQNVVRQITQQVNIVEEQVNNEIMKWVKSITHQIWRGKGADAFIQEMNSFMLPRGKQIIQSFTGFNGHIQRATTIMDQADLSVKKLSLNLGDLFDNIYKG